MPSDKERAVSHDGDIVKIDGRPVRMDHMVRDAFWADGCAVVLLDPDAFLDAPGGARRVALGTWDEDDGRVVVLAREALRRAPAPKRWRSSSAISQMAAAMVNGRVARSSSSLR